MSESNALLSCVEVGPAETGAARASVIWLHGLGADGHDFEAIVPELRLDPSLAVRFVLPHAPRIPVTVNGGMEMPAWYDIRDTDLNNRHDEVGVRASAAQLVRLIEREVERGVPCERIVLAGFSQGGAIATHVALRYPEKLAGLIALSTYLVLGDTVGSERSDANAAIPIFQAHGNMDPMVGYERGTALRDRLQADGYEVEWHEYPMMHQVCLEEIQAISTWLAARIG